MKENRRRIRSLNHTSFVEVWAGERGMNMDDERWNYLRWLKFNVKNEQWKTRKLKWPLDRTRNLSLFSL